ncbi:neurotrimin isoform X2 [Lepeophtheirus salmonis]|uniref:neurotrimin isoform X2 n=1 Tax=Lepeophtheirus salmonis TaxID=72036 RepID=UPI001AE7C237|nr:palladin-like [Lepeophtheirus salmonis]
MVFSTDCFKIFLIPFIVATTQVMSYSNTNDLSIQEDLNKLYDTKPVKVHTNSLNEKEHPHLDSDRTPYFDFIHSGDVTAVLGKTAILNCRVKNLGNKTVSWVRHDDTHLLTIGRYTYTSDLRFKAIHKELSEDYLLQIKPTTKRDAGKYECQISSTPPHSHIVNLEIAVPNTSILGGADIYFNLGSTINLTCLISESPIPPSYIFWRHNDEIISYDSTRGGVSVITDKGDSITSSFLIIQNAKHGDSGTYSCSPSLGDTISVNVHVLRGETSHQLILTNSSSFSPVFSLSALLFELLIQLIMIWCFYQ